MDFRYNSINKNNSNLTHEFFTIKPLSEWTFDNFVLFNQNGARNQKRVSSLKNTYLRLLELIIKDKNLPDDVKPLILNMIKDIKAKNPKNKQAPDFAVKVFGNMHGHIFNNTSNSMINMQHDREPPEEVRSQQQDQQESPEVVELQQEFQEEG